MDEIRGVTLDRAQAGAAGALIADAVQDEPMNRFVFDMDHPRTRALYARMAEGMVLWHLAGGNPLLAAMQGSRVVGVVALRNPQGTAGLLNTLRIGLPRVPGLLPLAARVRYRRLLAMRTLIAPSRNVPAPHYEIRILAVDRSMRRRGVARQLMGWAYELAAANSAVLGLYLQAGGTRNRTVYERLGYHMLDSAAAGGLTVYHLFRPIEET